LITLWVWVTASFNDTGHIVRAAICSSAVAMWFAPAIILLSAATAATFTASLILIVNTTRLLIGQWFPRKAAGPRTRFELQPCFGAALVTQSGLVAFLWGYPLLAAAFIAAGAAIVTALALLTGAYDDAGIPPALPQSFFSVLVTIVLAIVLLPGGGAGGEGSIPPVATPRSQPVSTLVAPPSDPGAESVVAKSNKAAEPSIEIGGQEFPGVVLRSEQSPQPMLLPLPQGRPGPRRVTISEPFSIPFSGEFWMFRPPSTRPPPDSFVRIATPRVLSFRTTDGARMEMEARQKLDAPVDPRCCTKLRLAIVNSDILPGTLLEVNLVDTAASRSEPLGAAFPSGAHRELLNYALPVLSTLKQFDEIRIIFRRIRLDKSVKIEIERFLLIPRNSQTPGSERQQIALLELPGP
jgi:hypothetical protein